MQNERFITKIFIVEDDPAFSMSLEMSLSGNENYELSLFSNGKDFLDNLHKNPDVISLDYNLPDATGLELFEKVKNFNDNIPVILFSAQKDVQVVVDAYKMGVRNYIVKGPDSLVEFQNAIKNLSENSNLKKEVDYWREQVIDRSKYNTIIGESPAIMKVLKMMQKVEKSNFLTLITGESGTGKEVVAQSIHFNSPRRKKPFVAVNVAAIPDDLMESELFGHEKGAFTGADSRRIGKFEEANGGTMFLDEIGEMDINMQTKLLRVLQESKVSRLGSNRETKLDLRIITATNKNLADRVKEGKFREDLYYRVQGFLIHLPPLRDRGNDIILLAKTFLQRFCSDNKIPVKKFSPDAMRAILDHRWPGNVRELKAFVERSVLISDTNEIQENELIFSPEI